MPTQFMDAFLLIAAFVVGYIVGNSGKSRPANDNSEIQYQTTQIDKKINLLLDNLGIEYGRSAVTSANATTPDDEIIQLLHQNKKIEAIKLYRQRTGLGLKEAKDAVDEIDRNR